MKQPRVARFAGASSVTTLSVGPGLAGVGARPRGPHPPYTPSSPVADVYAELEREELEREARYRAQRWADDGPAVVDEHPDPE